MLRGRQPRYERRPLSFWLASLDSSVPAEYFAAEQAVRRIGPTAVPHLVKMLRRRDSRFLEWLQQLIAGQGLMEVEFTPASVWRGRAHAAFVILGPEAGQAIPDLVTMLRDGREDVDVPSILASMGSLGVPPLREALVTTTNEFVRTQCITGLGCIGADSRPALHILVSLTRNTNGRVRGAAIRALGDIAELNEPIPMILTNAFWSEGAAFDGAYALWRARVLLPLIHGVTNANRRIQVASIVALTLLDMERSGRMQVKTPSDKARLSSLFNLKAMNASYMAYQGKAPRELLSALETIQRDAEPESAAASTAALAIAGTWTNPPPKLRSQARRNSNRLFDKNPN